MKAGQSRELPDRRPLVVGGDCSILLGIVPALRAQVGPVGLWFVDGHPDYLDGHASPTGETADMELAILTGTGAEPLLALAGTSPMVSAHDVVLLGHRPRDLDEDSAAELAHLLLHHTQHHQHDGLLDLEQSKKQAHCNVASPTLAPGRLTPALGAQPPWVTRRGTG